MENSLNNEYEPCFTVITQTKNGSQISVKKLGGFSFHLYNLDKLIALYDDDDEKNTVIGQNQTAVILIQWVKKTKLETRWPLEEGEK